MASGPEGWIRRGRGRGEQSGAYHPGIVSRFVPVRVAALVAVVAAGGFAAGCSSTGTESPAPIATPGSLDSAAPSSDSAASEGISEPAAAPAAGPRLPEPAATPAPEPQLPEPAATPAPEPQLPEPVATPAPEPQAPDPAAGPNGSTGLPDGADGPGIARWTVEILERRPHDPAAFTQGLEMADGSLYESTGLYGLSSLRRVDPATGSVTAETAVSADLFGEGLTVVDDRIVQLTWKAGRALVYDRATLELVGEFNYEGEGWGLCRSGGELVMSDGSDRLARRDPESFELIETVTVASPGVAVDRLNELECVDSLVIANVWQTPELLVIDLADGQVKAVIDGQPLLDDVLAAAPDPSTLDVLNGVAALNDGTFLITGKLWPLMYRVRVVEAS